MKAAVYDQAGARKRVILWLAASLALASVAAAEGRVYPSPEAVQPLGIGTSVPSVEVRSVTGEPVDLERMARSGALLVFYRGGW